MRVPDAIREYVLDILQPIAAKQVFELSARPDCPALLTDASNVISVDITTHTASSALAQYGTPQVALIVSAPINLKHLEVERLLAGLRNAGVATIIAVSESDPSCHREPWHIADYLALGFRRAEGSRALSKSHVIYRYDLHDYKLTPSWLNARHWANPRQWDKQRW